MNQEAEGTGWHGKELGGHPAAVGGEQDSRSTGP